LSADEYKQIGIRQGARSFQLRGGFIKQNQSLENLQELKGRSEKLKKPVAALSKSLDYRPIPLIYTVLISCKI
jgi:hypothetical protein